MKTVKGQPITASSVSMSKKAPYVPDAKETSQDEMRMIAEPPTPFKNKMTTAQMPTGTGASGNVSAGASGLKHSSPGVRALPPGGPVGQRKPINQSGQVNGRMGTSFPRKVGASPSLTAKRNARFYGE